MIRDTPALRAKIKDARTRDSGNTLLHKKFNGGHISIAGANSPVGLASRPIRILLCDEVDKYPVSAGTEGDPVSLAMKRTANFWNRKILLVSTPTVKGRSKIEEHFNISTQDEWCVPCPGCGEYQPFIWENIIYKDVSEPVMQCQHCRKRFNQLKWQDAAHNGLWISKEPNSMIKGFHLNAFASPWVSWKSLTDSYEEALKIGPERVQVFVNTVLGLPYEDTSGTLQADNIISHAETYNCEVPDDVLVLTCGVDTQDDRLELEVVGWGLKNKSWGIEYKIIYGNPGLNEIWQELDAYLAKTFYYADGSGINIACACIDSGGHYTDEVYKFCKGKSRRNIFAIKGIGTFGHPSISKPSRNNRLRIPLFMLGVNTIKGLLYGRLEIDKKSSAGYCAFPAEKEKGYDEVYYQGLLSERMVVKREKGQEKIIWEPRSKDLRNEPLDCRVYATAAYEILSPDMMRRAQSRGFKPEIPEKQESIQVPKKKITRKIRIINRGIRM